MDGQRTEGPPTLLERATVAAGAGVCGAAIAAAGSYAFLYGIFYQFSAIPGASVNSGFGGSLTALFFLLIAVAMSVTGGALVSKAMGVRTWQRAILISTIAHAVGIPLWTITYLPLTLNLEGDNTFEGLGAFPAATYAFVVPVVVLLCAYGRDKVKGLAITLPLAVATVALPVTALLTGSEGLALASAVVAWVMLPAVSVLGSAMIGLRNLS